ncbi:unnamed protein product, partial [Didymodactylos carnosus]
EKCREKSLTTLEKAVVGLGFKYTCTDDPESKSPGLEMLKRTAWKMDIEEILNSSSFIKRFQFKQQNQILTPAVKNENNTMNDMEQVDNHGEKSG